MSHNALLPTAALLLSGVLVAGCTGSRASPASRATKSPAKSAPAAAAASNCLLPPGLSCYTPRQFRVAYGIQPVLDRGIDGGGETVTVIDSYGGTPVKEVSLPAATRWCWPWAVPRSPRTP